MFDEGTKVGELSMEMAFDGGLSVGYILADLSCSELWSGCKETSINGITSSWESGREHGTMEKCNAV